MGGRNPGEGKSDNEGRGWKGTDYSDSGKDIACVGAETTEGYKKNEQTLLASAWCDEKCTIGMNSERVVAVVGCN